MRLKYVDIFIVSSITLFLCSKCCGNYLRAETIQGQKLFVEIQYLERLEGKIKDGIFFFVNKSDNYSVFWDVNVKRVDL